MNIFISVVNININININISPETGLCPPCLMSDWEGWEEGGHTPHQPHRTLQRFQCVRQ